MRVWVAAVGIAGSFALAAPSHARIKVGVILSVTGPAASAGLLEQRALPMLPARIGAEPVEYVVLDDASDTTRAVSDAQKLLATEQVDLLIAVTATPTSIAVMPTAAEAQTPQIALAPVGDKVQRWTFVAPPSFDVFARAVVADLARRGLTKVAFIGYADSLGQAWLEAIQRAAEGGPVKVGLVERYNRADTTILSQVLRIVASRPDAVIVGATSSSATEPQRFLVERGFRGPIYHTQAAATADFIRAAGASAATALLPVALPIVAEQLPADAPSRARAMEFVHGYEGANGENSRNNFASHLWDAGLLLEAAAPKALASAQPGTPAFRATLRDALEQVRELRVSNGVVTMSPGDHDGYDDRAAAIARVEDGRFVLAR